MTLSTIEKALEAPPRTSLKSTGVRLMFNILMGLSMFYASIGLVAIFDHGNYIDFWFSFLFITNGLIFGCLSYLFSEQPPTQGEGDE